MIVSNWRKAFLPLVLSVVLIFTGCSSKEPSKYAATQKETSGRNAPAAVAKRRKLVVTSINFSLKVPVATPEYSPKRRKALLKPNSTKMVKTSPYSQSATRLVYPQQLRNTKIVSAS
jgi:hypothetical protein